MSILLSCIHCYLLSWVVTCNNCQWLKQIVRNCWRSCEATTSIVVCCTISIMKSQLWGEIVYLQVFFQEVKIRMQILDLITYMLVVLANMEQVSEGFQHIFVGVSSCSLLLLKTVISVMGLVLFCQRWGGLLSIVVFSPLQGWSTWSRRVEVEASWQCYMLHW